MRLSSNCAGVRCRARARWNWLASADCPPARHGSAACGLRPPDRSPPPSLQCGGRGNRSFRDPCETRSRATPTIKLAGRYSLVRGVYLAFAAIVLRCLLIFSEKFAQIWWSAASRCGAKTLTNLINPLSSDLGHTCGLTNAFDRGWPRDHPFHQACRAVSGYAAPSCRRRRCGPSCARNARDEP